MSKKIRAGVIGAGFIGCMHVDALRRLGDVEVLGLAHTPRTVQEKAAQLGIPRTYASYQEMLEDPEIDVVHNCTPTWLHTEVNRAIILAGKHVFSEKPLAMTAEESAGLLELLKDARLVHGVNFNYRTYPLVQQMKAQVQAGGIGPVKLVHGYYLQDWLLHEHDYNWRVDPSLGGPTRAIGDLGSHWCDLVQTITGLKIVEVMADFATTLPTRKKMRSATTFARVDAQGEYDEVAVESEDWASVLIRFDNGAKGVFSVSEVCAGRKCYFTVEVNGTKRSLYWNQEEGDRMMIGNRDEPNQLVMRDPNALDPRLRGYALAPVGHPEGWLDALKNNIAAYYDYVREGRQLNDERPDFATFHDGHDIMLITDAIAESNRRGAWVKIKR